MKLFLITLTTCFISTSALAWSGSVLPEGKLPPDPYALTLDAGNDENDEAGDEGEALSYLIQEKPVEYWLEYARRFSLMPNERMLEEAYRDRPAAKIYNNLFIVGASSRDPKVFSQKLDDIKFDMVLYATAMSAWKTVKHMKPNQFSEFLATDLCKETFGSWYCNFLRENGYQWATDDGINYSYSIGKNGVKSLEDAVKSAYFQ